MLPHTALFLQTIDLSTQMRSPYFQFVLEEKKKKKIYSVICTLEGHILLQIQLSLSTTAIRIKQISVKMKSSRNAGMGQVTDCNQNYKN